MLIAQAAAYAAEAAAAVGDRAAALRLAAVAQDHAGFAGEVDTRAVSWARIAAAWGNTGDTGRADGLLDRIEETPDDIV